MELSSIEKHTIRKMFPRECKDLPYKELTEQEQYLVDKCIEKEYFTREEYLELSRLLKRYRPHLKEYKEIETVMGDNERIIKSEKELLDLLDDQSNYEFQYKLHFGVKTKWVRLRVAPLTDSRLNTAAQDHLRLMSDLSQNERRVNDKVTRGEPLSPEENQLLEKVNKKFQDKISDEDYMQEITKQLNNQVSFVDFDTDDSLKVWNKISGADRITILE